MQYILAQRAQLGEPTLGTDTFRRGNSYTEATAKLKVKGGDEKR